MENVGIKSHLHQALKRSPKNVIQVALMAKGSKNKITSLEKLFALEQKVKLLETLSYAFL